MKFVKYFIFLCAIVLLSTYFTQLAFAISVSSEPLPNPAPACIGVDERAFTVEQYNLQGASRVNAHPNPGKPSEGGENSQTWSRMTSAAGGCVQVWCANDNFYAKLTWPLGYDAGAARTKYTLTVWTASTGSVTLPALPANTSTTTTLIGPTSQFTGKEFVFNVANGFGENGWPFTAITNASCTTSAPGTTTAPSSPPLAYGTGNVAAKFEAIDALNNAKPKHLQRQLTVYFYPSNGYASDPTGKSAAGVFTENATFQGGDPNDSSNALFGAFVNPEFNIGNLPTGDYYVLIKSLEGSLRELASSQKIHIDGGKANVIINTDTSAGQTLKIPQLRMGDINNDNVVDINDYAILVDCYGAKMTQSSCTNHHASDLTKGLFSDLNDDNVVDGIDYNILIRNFSDTGL